MTQVTAQGPIDVIYALGTGSAWGDNEELRYSLRALERNFADLGRVIIVGARPKWLGPRATHVPAEDRYPGRADANIISKLLLGCRRAAASPWFVRSSDDELFLRPTRFADMRGYHRGELGAARPSTGGGSRWHRRLRSTGRYLRAQGHRARFFDCHAPVPMRRDRFMELMAGAPYQRDPGLTVDSLYFNCDDAAPKARLRGEVVQLSEPPPTLAALEHAIASAHLLNYRDSSLNDVLKRFLRETFACPSRFESAIEEDVSRS